MRLGVELVVTTTRGSRIEVANVSLPAGRASRTITWAERTNLSHHERMPRHSILPPFIAVTPVETRFAFRGLLALTLVSLAACVPKADYDSALADIGNAHKAYADLESQLAACQASSGTMPDADPELQAKLDASEAELAELRKQREAAEKRLAAFNSLNEKLRSLIDAGELEVSMRNGLPVIALPSEVLFSSGQAELAKKGEKALLKVGAALAELPNQRIQVAGHTDDMPIGEKLEWTDNWELSSARALTVTRFLITHGVNPTNLSAAGHSEFDPVASNASTGGRKKNRRIELILLPDLTELTPISEAPSEG
jgi:chemotaxis protein MotB